MVNGTQWWNLSYWKFLFFMIVCVEEKRCFQSLAPSGVWGVYQGQNESMKDEMTVSPLESLWGISPNRIVVFLLVLYGPGKAGSTRSCTVLLKATGEWRGSMLVHHDDKSRTKSFHWSSEFSFLSCYCKGTQFGILLTCFKISLL